MSKKNSEISRKFKVERSNELNTLNPKGLNLTEIRFLAIYQAKINARNPESRTVVFPLSSFCKIMEIKRLNITQMKETVRSLLCKPVFLPTSSGKNGFVGVPLFNECDTYQDEKNGEWFVKIECHPKVLPYMFEMKKNYFTYELWNALNLASVNQIRMYEILKQYEKIGTRTIEIDELKNLLGIEPNQYSLFKNFRVRVLESCQKALEQRTDIQFTFEPIRKGRKIYALKFNITKNPKFKDDLKLKEFINPSDLSDIIEFPKPFENENVGIDEKNMENIIPISDTVNKVYVKCKKAYTIEQIEDLLDLAEMISDNPEAYIVSVYRIIKARNTKINNIYNYTLSVIQADLKKSSSVSSKKERKKTSYDLDEFKDFIHSTKRNMVGDDYLEETQLIQEIDSNALEEIPSDDFEDIYDDFEEILRSGEIPF